MQIVYIPQRALSTVDRERDFHYRRHSKSVVFNLLVVQFFLFMEQRLRLEFPLRSIAPVTLDTQTMYTFASLRSRWNFFFRSPFSSSTYREISFFRFPVVDRLRNVHCFFPPLLHFSFFDSILSGRFLFYLWNYRLVYHLEELVRLVFESSAMMRFSTNYSAVTFCFYCIRRPVISDFSVHLCDIRYPRFS